MLGNIRASRGTTLQSSQQSAAQDQPLLVILSLEQAMAAGDIDRAARLAQQAIEAGQAHPLLFETRGLWKQQHGLLKDALADLQSAHALAPKSTRVLCALAETLNALGRPRMAILACGDALAIDPALAHAWLQKGLGHRQLNQPERAGDCFLRAVQHDPQMVPAYAQLANLAALQGQGDKARLFAGHALAIAPGDLLAVMALARADLADGRFESAQTHLEALLARTSDPGIRSFALAGLGDVCDFEGRHAEAFDYYEAEASAAAGERHITPFAEEPAREQIRRVTAILESLPPKACNAAAW